MSPRRGGQGWVPDRGDVIWIDHNSQAGREMKDHHPFAVDLGPIPDRPGAHSYVLCQQLKSFDWRARGARPHPIGRLNDTQLEEVMAIVGQILGLVV